MNKELLTPENIEIASFAIISLATIATLTIVTIDRAWHVLHAPDIALGKYLSSKANRHEADTKNTNGK